MNNSTSALKEEEENAAGAAAGAPPVATAVAEATERRRFLRNEKRMLLRWSIQDNQKEREQAGDDRVRDLIDGFIREKQARLEKLDAEAYDSA